MNYKDVVVEQNNGKVYMCKLLDGSEVCLQVHDTCDSAQVDMVLYVYDTNDDIYYREHQISKILYEVEFDDEDLTHYDSFDAMDFDSIQKYLIQKQVYSYQNKEQLKEIYNALNKPIVSGVGLLYDKLEDEYLNYVKDFGVNFYWSEYDDFSCYGDGFTHRVKIID